MLNTICILCFFGRLCNTAERRSCSIFFHFLLFSRYSFHFHIRFMKVEFHTFFRISLCRSWIPTEHFASYGKFHFLYTKILHTKGHMKKLLPFSMRPVFSIPGQQNVRRTSILLFQISEAASCIKKLQPADKPACPISPGFILWTDIHRFWCRS